MRPRPRFLRPRLESLEDRRLLVCDTFIREQTLFVLGDEGDNVVEIVGVENGVHVKCDGRSQAFPGVAAVNAQLGSGDDAATIDNRQGLLAGVAILGPGKDRCRTIGRIIVRNCP